MPKKKRAGRAAGEPPNPLRVLPSVGQDVVHILDGRRVVTVNLPPRSSTRSVGNLARVVAVTGELYRRALARRLARPS